MAKINISFNGTKYLIDESSLSSSTNALKSYILTAMNGSGATIKLDGTIYNINSAKLSAATNAFTAYLSTVAGSGHKVIVNGVEYGVDGTKVAGAISALEAMLSGLSCTETREVIFEEQELTFTPYEWIEGFYAYESNVCLSLTVGETYQVVWDGEVHTFVAFDVDENTIAIGNKAIVDLGENTGESFIIADEGSLLILSFDQATSHTVAIYKVNGSSDNTGDILDNEWPIEWNTKAVMGNATFQAQSTPMIKVSNLTPTEAEIRTGKISITNNGITETYHCSTNGVSSTNEYVAAFFMNDDEDGSFEMTMVVSAFEPVSNEDATIPERGLYVINYGREDVQNWNMNADCKFEIVEAPTDGSDTLTWDGNVEGLESVKFEEEVGFYRVSDVVPTVDDCVNGAKITFSTGESINATFENIQELYDSVGFLHFETAMVIPYDGFELEDIVVPKAGVYFYKEGEAIYNASLTIHGYNGF